VLGDAEQVLAEGSTGVVVPRSGRLVALVGVDDVVIVDTPDALLVTTRARAQEVKQLVDRLRESGRADLT
jgi:mannose-1-phosphate guanylyltransferase